MLNLLKALFTVSRPLSADQLELEYLRGSHSRLNLEHRQREVENGLFRIFRAY